VEDAAGAGAAQVSRPAPTTRASAPAAALLATAIALCASPAAADEAQGVFLSLYGPELKRVRATPAAEDDLVLARQIIDAARNVLQDRLAEVMLRGACDLAGAHAAGNSLAVEAMTLLAIKVPPLRGDCLEQTLSLHRRRYSAAHGVGRTAAAQDVVECLLALAELEAGKDDFASAVRRLQHTSAYVTGLPAELKERVRGAGTRLAARQRVANDIAAMRARLAKDATDQDARDRLIELLLVERDAPNAAAKLLEAGCSEEMKTLLPLAAMDPNAIAEAACLQLGEWYRSLAGRASPDAKGAMLRRAARCYSGFLARHKAADADRAAAAERLRELRAAPGLPAAAHLSTLPAAPE